MCGDYEWGTAAKTTRESTLEDEAYPAHVFWCWHCQNYSEIYGLVLVRHHSRALAGGLKQNEGNLKRFHMGKWRGQECGLLSSRKVCRLSSLPAFQFPSVCQFLWRAKGIMRLISLLSWKVILSTRGCSEGSSRWGQLATHAQWTGSFFGLPSALSLLYEIGGTTTHFRHYFVWGTP